MAPGRLEREDRHDRRLNRPTSGFASIVVGRRVRERGVDEAAAGDEFVERRPQLVPIGVVDAAARR